MTPHKMLGIPKIKTIRRGRDARTSEPIDMAFDTDYYLHFITKAIRKVGGGTVNHNIGYAPEVVVMEELAPTEDRPEKAMGGYKGEFNSVKVTDNSVILPDSPEGTFWVYTKLYPLAGSPTTERTPAKRIGHPVIKVGTGVYDWQKKLHTRFDAMKIYKTGKLEVHASAKTYHTGSALGDVTIATYRHNLGYIPMIAPFINHNTLLNAYHDWLSQYYNRRVWQLGHTYFSKERVTVSTSSSIFRCKKTHVPSSSNQPGVGANWTTYWEKIFTAPPAWVNGKSYAVGEYVDSYYEWPGGISWGVYKCIAGHVASSSNKPVDGDNWMTYWDDASMELWEQQGLGLNYDTHLNDMEDVKVVYGGIEPFNAYVVEYYVTKTDLVLKLIRHTYDWEGLFPGEEWAVNEPLMAVNISVDFTIFSNRADEEFDLLTN